MIRGLRVYIFGIILGLFIIILLVLLKKENERSSDTIFVVPAHIVNDNSFSRNKVLNHGSNTTNNIKQTTSNGAFLKVNPNNEGSQIKKLSSCFEFSRDSNDILLLNATNSESIIGNIIIDEGLD